VRSQNKRKERINETVIERCSVEKIGSNWGNARFTDEIVMEVVVRKTSRIVKLTTIAC
jgi:hypothetical protein